MFLRTQSHTHTGGETLVAVFHFFNEQQQRAFAIAFNSREREGAESCSISCDIRKQATLVRVCWLLIGWF